MAFDLTAYRRASDAANELITERGCYGDADAIERLAEDYLAKLPDDPLFELIASEMILRAEHIRGLEDRLDGFLWTD